MKQNESRWQESEQHMPLDCLEVTSYSSRLSKCYVPKRLPRSTVGCVGSIHFHTCAFLGVSRWTKHNIGRLGHRTGVVVKCVDQTQETCQSCVTSIWNLCFPCRTQLMTSCCFRGSLRLQIEHVLLHEHEDFRPTNIIAPFSTSNRKGEKILHFMREIDQTARVSRADRPTTLWSLSGWT